ncbi:DNA polymerase III epsilon subunit [Vibrio chagasii]|nr:DNA polymerase III epsilon subunit [Vibrio chagasii]
MAKLSIMCPDKITKWAKVIRDTLSKGVDVVIVGDTETTGKSELGDKKNFGRKDRILEIGFLLYTEDSKGLLTPLLDEEGEHIFFHEYINPFTEDEFILERYNSIRSIPEEVIVHVHGIDLEFLNGESGMVLKNGGRGDVLLKNPALSFTKVKPYIELMFDIHNLNTRTSKLKFIAHNALFDVQFMNAEWFKSELLEEKAKNPCVFEAFIHTVDTLRMAQSLYSRNELSNAALSKGISSKSGFSLDFLQIFYGIEIERDMHGALLDSKILAEVYNAIISDSKFQNAPQTVNKKFTGYERELKRPPSLPTF